MKLRTAFVVAMSAALLQWSCAGPVPPLPAISLEGVDREVRDAVTAALKQAEADPSSGPASGRLAMVLQANSLNQPAQLAYQRAIRLEPKEFAWRYDLALVLDQLTQPEKALESISAALSIRPDYVPALQKRGELLFKLGRSKESASVYESLLAKNPASAEALYGLARAKDALDDKQAAEDLYRKACQAYPNFGAAYYGWAVVGRSLGHEAESAKNFELAKLHANDHPPVDDPVLSEVAKLSTGVFRHLETVNQLAKQGRMEEAAKLNEEMLARDPENLALLVNLLYLARFLERLDPRVDAVYNSARRLDPNNALLYNYYGVVMVRQGKFDAASTALRKAIELKPDYGEPHKWLGEILERQHRPAEAIEHYSRVLALDPTDRPIQMKLWWALVVNGRGREAIPQLLPALELDDSYTSMRLVLLGEAYRTTGDFGKSRQILEQARSRVRSQGPPDLLAQIEQELKDLPQR